MSQLTNKPLEGLFCLAFNRRDVAEQLVQLDPIALESNAAYPIIRDAIAYQLANCAPEDYALDKASLDRYALGQGVIPNLRAGVSSTYSRCIMLATKPYEAPTLLDAVRSDASRRLASTALRQAKASGDYAGAIDQMRTAGVDAPKVDALANAVAKKRDELVWTDWSKVDAEIRWLWQDHLPIGVSLLAGIGGVGKSTVMLNIAAAITTGGTFPNGEIAPLGDVLLISAEDDAAVSKLRFQAQGGDFSRFHKLNKRIVKGEDKYFELGDVKTLQMALDAFPQTKLIVIDPIHAFTGDKCDSHKNADVRRVMTPLVELAGARGIAVVGIIHFGKDNQKAAWSRISGSGAWRDLARAVFVATRDRSDEGLGLLVLEKHNYSARQKTIGYRMGDEMNNLTIKWDTTVGNITADEALNGRDVQPKLTGATDWLRDFLDAGEQAATEIQAAARVQGITYDTLRRASDELGVEKRRVGFRGPWQWSLPTAATVSDDERPF